MWCVADLNEEYIAKMEDVLETHERPDQKGTETEQKSDWLSQSLLSRSGSNCC
jgi:hypothetical protein